MRLLREPLLHFLVLGGAIFAAHALISGDAAGRDSVVVTRGRIESLVGQFVVSHGRPPDPAERSDLIQAWVREEILCREAVSLGLDREDAVIRDRLRQKMEFVAGGGADARYREIARHYKVTIEDAAGR
jgi:hypothetical protein